MEEKRRIEELWRYLKIQDDTILVIFRYSYAKECDEYIAVRSDEGHLDVRVYDNIERFDLSLYKFGFVQYRGADGKYTIPSVQDLVKDELEDY